MSRELSVLVVCGDDEDALRALADRTQRTLARSGIDGELVLVDDAGGAQVATAVDDLAAAHPNVVALHHDRRHGRIASWTSALAQSGGRLVCTLEPGAGYRPEGIARLWRELTVAQAEIAQGVCRPRGAVDRVVGLLLGLPGADVGSTFVLTTREVLADVLGHADQLRDAPSLLAAVAALRGYGVRQVEMPLDGAGASEVEPLGALARAVVSLRLEPPRDPSVATAVPGAAAVDGARPPGWRSEVSAHLADLRRSQWLGADDLRALQRRRLVALVAHAARHVEHYRRRLERLGITDDDDGAALVDLTELPLLERAMLCDDHGLTLVSPSRDPARARRVVTAGASGELHETFVDAGEAAMRDALAARHLEWAGLRPGELQVRLRFGAPARGTLADVRLRAEATLAHTVVLAIGNGGEDDVDLALARLARLGPMVLEGCAEALALLASRTTGVRVGAVVSSGQSLDPALRRRFEQAFGAKVFDRYVTRELGVVAQECEAHAGLHVNAETHVVEILRDGRVAPDGEEGEVIVTSLGNRIAPLLRYRIGDVAALVREPCACKRAAPRLIGLRGRPLVFVRGEPGRWVPSAVLARLFRAHAAVVRRYQVVQERDGRVIVRVVRKAGFSALSETALRRELGELLGVSAAIDLVLVEWLAPDAVPYVSETGVPEWCQPPLAL